jgi:hypothetical protein
MKIKKYLASLALSTTLLQPLYGQEFKKEYKLIDSLAEKYNIAENIDLIDIPSVETKYSRDSNKEFKCDMATAFLALTGSFGLTYGLTAGFFGQWGEPSAAESIGIALGSAAYITFGLVYLKHKCK